MARAGNCDAGKTVEGRKRHILTDTPGLTIEAAVHATKAGRSRLSPE